MEFKSKKPIYRYLISAVLILVCLLCSLSITPIYADFEGASDVLTDLQKDPEFDTSKYSENARDTSLQLIQIAESTSGELLVYVYQPSGQALDLRASSINISTAINDSFSPKNYTLSYINSNGVFYKYVVNDFTILSDTIRYYSIVSIFRPWDENLDDPAEGDNTISEQSFEVSKLITATTLNGVVSYTCLDTKSIDIVSKYVGFVRYDNGFTLYNQACDSHYVAFSTNMPIEKLMDADVCFISQEVTYRTNLTGSHRYSEGNLITNEITLSDIDTAGSSAHGWFADKYEWQRIESVNDFKAGLAEADITLTSEAETALKEKQWVLRFYESDYQLINSSTIWEYVTEVTDVTLLRLRFETAGVVYNLGVVDNKQSGDINPDGTTMPDWLETLIKTLVGIVIGVLAIAVLIPLFPYILSALVWLFKAIVWLLKYLCIGLWYFFKYLGIGLWYVLKYLGLGIWYLIASPYYLFKYIQSL